MEQQHSLATDSRIQAATINLNVFPTLMPHQGATQALGLD